MPVWGWSCTIRQKFAAVEVGGVVSVGVTGQDLHSAFVHAPTGIAVLTPTGVVTGGNPALVAILRRELTELVGGTLFPFTHPDDLPAAVANCASMATGSVMVVREDCRFVRPDTTAVWVRVSTSRVEASEGRAAHLIMHVEDISEQKALEARLVHQALHDPLTGVGNRALLHQQVTADLTAPNTNTNTATNRRDGAEAGAGAATGGAPGRVGGLVVLDLDGFKALNDAYGHPAGDTALIEVAHRVQGLVRPQDLVVRLGGDEFVVWCPDTTPTQVAALVDALHTTIAAPCRLAADVVQLAASIGSATHTMQPGRDNADLSDGPGEDLLARLLRMADTAMYDDKHRAGCPPR